MSIYEFNKLNAVEQYQTIWKRGTYLCSRMEEGRQVFTLHDMGNFWAELHYDANANRIVKIYSFCTTRLLEPYLKLIQLPEI